MKIALKNIKVLQFRNDWLYHIYITKITESNVAVIKHTHYRHRYKSIIKNFPEVCFNILREIEYFAKNVTL